ncbi:MAG: phage tail sheath subtilisin-like domain-containing protein [Desulfovibrionaceae bacterium]
MAISFLDIPLNLRTPGVYVEFDPSQAMQGLSVMNYRVLLVGQRTASGSVGALTFKRVTNAADPKTWFGAGSHLALMAAAFLENNSTTEVFAVALDDDASAVAATGTLTLTGTATAAGVLAFYVGGQRVRVNAAVGDTAAAVATALAAAVTAAVNMPVTAAAESGVLTLTAKNKGLCGNDIDLRVNYASDESTPAGLTAVVAAMSGGAANPDLAPLIAALGDDWYHFIAMPYRDSTSLMAVEDELDSRWGPLRQIEGHCITADSGDHSTLGTLGDSRNSPHLTIMGCHGSPSTAWEWAAAICAVMAFYGNIDQARPFQTLPVAGVLAPADEDRFTRAERNLLLYDGISTHTVDADGSVRIERLITTYKTSAAGAEDTAYLDVNTKLTLGYLRHDLRVMMRVRYPRHKLASDGTRYGVGQAVATPKGVKSEIVSRARLWEESGLVEGVDDFKRSLICERNTSDPNRMDIRLRPDLVNQFRVAAIQIQHLL